MMYTTIQIYDCQCVKLTSRYGVAKLLVDSSLACPVGEIVSLRYGVCEIYQGQVVKSFQSLDGGCTWLCLDEVSVASSCCNPGDQGLVGHLDDYVRQHVQGGACCKTPMSDWGCGELKKRFDQLFAELNKQRSIRGVM